MTDQLLNGPIKRKGVFSCFTLLNYFALSFIYLLGHNDNTISGSGRGTQRGPEEAAQLRRGAAPRAQAPHPGRAHR